MFWRFLCLGCYSFGGPAAHVAYFRRALVDRHQWLSERSFTQKVALTQWLPGPGSSQLGFAIGLEQAGLMGGLAAFLGFTLPSFGLMLALAMGSAWLFETSWFTGLVQALKLLAVVVVADAIYTMFRSFCQLWWQRLVMVLGVMVLLLWPGFVTQMLVLSLAALIGLTISAKINKQPAAQTQLFGQSSLWWLLLFTLLLVASFVWFNNSQEAHLAAGFYQSGALVFGGGHVVLPLLQATVAEPLSTEKFLTGYAAAQAVPGPMFTMATYLGAELIPASPVLGAVLATCAVFLPGFLLVLACRHLMNSDLSSGRFSGAIEGLNAVVVGVLAAAWYDPVITSAINAPTDVLWALLGLVLLRLLKVPIILLVIFFVFIGLFWY